MEQRHYEVPCTSSLLLIINSVEPFSSMELPERPLVVHSQPAAQHVNGHATRPVCGAAFVGCFPTKDGWCGVAVEMPAHTQGAAAWP